MSSGSSALDETSCNVLRSRARFEPLAAGQELPEARVYVHPIIWNLPSPVFAEMPRDSHGDLRLFSMNAPDEGASAPKALNDAFASAPLHQPSESGETLLRLTIDPAGRVRTCHIYATTVSAALAGTYCPAYLEYARYAPARDKAGNAVETVWHELVVSEKSD